MTARDRTTFGIRRRNLSSHFRQLILAALGMGLMLVMWALAAAATEPVRIPSPILVFDAIRQNLVEIRALEFASFGTGGIVQNLTYTTVNVLIGVAAGAVAGFAIGLLIGRVRVIRNLLEPPLLFVGTVPVLVLLPFLSLWFGTGRLATNGMVIFYTMVTVAVVTQQATTNISNHYDNYALSLGASSTRVLLQVIRPAVIPEVLGAVRVAWHSVGDSRQSLRFLVGRSGQGESSGSTHSTRPPPRSCPSCSPWALLQWSSMGLSLVSVAGWSGGRNRAWDLFAISSPPP